MTTTGRNASGNWVFTGMAAATISVASAAAPAGRTHAWGLAIDWDPAHNKLKWGRDRARLARPEYDTWWRLWEEEGWVSLGRTRNFDWMHVQAVKL